MKELQKVKEIMHTVVETLKPIREIKDHVREFGKLENQIDLPLEVMVLGEFNAGKSTFINAMLGQEILQSDVTPATAAITKMTYGEREKVILHNLDGTQTVYPFGKLKNISAEGHDEGKQVREKLAYLEVQLTNPLLKGVSIIDTPGLNSQNALHTEKTQSFLSDSDIVLWLFSYTNVGKDSELNALRRVNEYIRPLGVVNGIDQHDEEEEELGGFLQTCKQRLHGVVSDVVGVSAILALQGQVEPDVQKLKDSRWEDFMQILARMTSDEQARQSKLNRFFLNLHRALLRLDEELQEHYKKFDRYRSILSNYPLYKDSIVKRIQSLQALADEWKQARKVRTYEQFEQLDFPEGCSACEETISLVEQQVYVYEELGNEVQRLQERGRRLQQRENDLDHIRIQLEADWKAYNNSGWKLVNLFDWTGKKGALESRQEALNEKYIALNRDKGLYRLDCEQLEEKKGRVIYKLCKLSLEMEKGIQQEIKKQQEEYKERSALKKATKEFQKLMWVMDVYVIMKQEIVPLLEVAIEECLTSASKDSTLVERIKSCRQVLQKLQAVQVLKKDRELLNYQFTTRKEISRHPRMARNLVVSLLILLLVAAGGGYFLYDHPYAKVFHLENVFKNFGE